MLIVTSVTPTFGDDDDGDRDEGPENDTRYELER
jgi:hypothetical protein